MVCNSQPDFMVFKSKHASAAFKFKDDSTVCKSKDDFMVFN